MGNRRLFPSRQAGLLSVTDMRGGEVRKQSEVQGKLLTIHQSGGISYAKFC
jgi:hypothetical protein